MSLSTRIRNYIKDQYLKLSTSETNILFTINNEKKNDTPLKFESDSSNQTLHLTFIQEANLANEAKEYIENFIEKRG